MVKPRACLGTYREPAGEAEHLYRKGTPGGRHGADMAHCRRLQATLSAHISLTPEPKFQLKAPQRSRSARREPSQVGFVHPCQLNVEDGAGNVTEK